MATAKAKLKVSTGIAYGVGDLGGNLFFTALSFWLLYYLTDEVGISTALAGFVGVIGRIWDAVTDPAVGFLSDRTKSRLGRRRPWILLGAFPFALGFFFLFANPFPSATQLRLSEVSPAMGLIEVYNPGENALMIEEGSVKVNGLSLPAVEIEAKGYLQYFYAPVQEGENSTIEMTAMNKKGEWEVTESYTFKTDEEVFSYSLNENGVWLLTEATLGEKNVFSDEQMRTDDEDLISAFTSTRDDRQMLKFIVMALFYMLACTGATLVNIPYNSLAPDLTDDFDERTKLSAYRMSFAVIGTLAGAVAAGPLIASGETLTQGFMIMAAVFAILMLASSLVPGLFLREPQQNFKPNTEGLLKSYLATFKCKPFVIVLIPWVLNTIAVTIVTGSMIYYFRYVLENEGLMPIAMGVLLISSMIFIPLNTPISKKIGKAQTYSYGMFLFAAGMITVFFIGHLIPTVWLFGIMVISGMGFSTQYVMPWALVPDAIDSDYAETGKKREGVFYGIWTFMVKLGQALAFWLTSIVMTLIHYVPNVVQTPKTNLGLRFLVGPFAAIFSILASVVVLFYPIGKKEYEEIQAKIKKIESK